MPLTEVQQVVDVTDNVANVVIDFAQTTQNNLCVVGIVSDVLIHGGTGAPAGWNRVNPYQNGFAEVALFWRLAPSGTHTQVTFTAVAGDKVAIFWEYSGVDTAAPFSRSAVGGNTTYSTGTTGVTDTADQLAVAIVGASGSNTIAPTAPNNSFVLEASQASGPGDGTEVGLGAATRALTQTGTWSTTFTGPGGNASGGVIATFRAAVGGGGNTVQGVASLVAGAGILLSDGSRVVRGEVVSAAADGSLLTVGVRQSFGVSELSGDAAILAAAAIRRVWGEAALLGGPGNLHALGEAPTQGTAVLSGVAAELLGMGRRVAYGHVGLEGAPGGLDAQGRAETPPTAILVGGSAVLAADAVRSVVGSVSLVASPGSLAVVGQGVAQPLPMGGPLISEPVTLHLNSEPFVLKLIALEE